MNVVTTEQGCEFSFDYSKVYWNPRLQHEHQLVVDSFKEGQAVCDVMAGVGPFAMPAGKKRIFVLANDLNPYGYERMKYIIKRNKLWGFVEPHNMDGREFIKWATKSLYADPPRTASIPLKIPKSQQNKNLPTKGTKRRISTERLPTTLEYSSPPTFDHFIMNLPATAINFLDAFIGVYAGQEKLFQPRTDRKLPLIHVYCFAGNSEDQLAERIEICDRISERIDYKITPEDCATGSGNKAIELAIRDVRLVSPTKMMYCATFRLPAEVAFRKV
jgi:tRNA (guanine37-N1)-methyltransferase